MLRQIIVLRHVKFQFLIGRLVTEELPDDELPLCTFQFLIGRLVTAFATASKGPSFGFNSS